MSTPPENDMLRSPESAEYAVVHSGNFLDYCFPSNLDLPPQYFANSLELPFVAPDLEKIEGYAQNRGNMYGPDTNLYASGMHREATALLENVPPSLSRVELGLTRYFDRQKNGYFAADVIDDDENTTYHHMMPDVYGLIGDGHFPLVHTHQHPEPTLFSYPDFKVMIKKGAYPNQPNFRPVKSILLDLPDNYQVLAVATSWTPLLEKEDESELSRYWESRFDEMDRKFEGARDRMSDKEWRKKVNTESHDLHMELLTSMGVKSYISRDRRNFYSFTGE